MNDIKKDQFMDWLLLQPIFLSEESRSSIWQWIDKELTEAKIEVLRKVYVNIYTKDEIPNIILQLEKK
jgi:hypothetical protein